LTLQPITPFTRSISTGSQSCQCRASDLTGGDRLEGKSFQQKSKDDPHETCEDLRECDKAFLSSRDPKMLGMSEANQASSDALAADSRHIRWSDKSRAWRVSL